MINSQGSRIIFSKKNEDGVTVEIVEYYDGNYVDYSVLLDDCRVGELYEDINVAEQFANEFFQ